MTNLNETYDDPKKLANDYVHEVYALLKKRNPGEVRIFTSDSRNIRFTYVLFFQKIHIIFEMEFLKELQNLIELLHFEWLGKMTKEKFM